MLGRDPNNYLFDGTPNIKQLGRIYYTPMIGIALCAALPTTSLATATKCTKAEFRLSHAKGGWIWVWSRGSTLRDAQGKRTSKP